MAVFEASDPGLAQHFKSAGVKLGGLLWSTWTNIYTDVLTKSDWLLLFDHLVSYPEYPEIFLLLVVSELLLKRDAFSQCSDEGLLKHQLEHFKVDNIKLALRKTVELLAGLSRDAQAGLALKRAIPLQQGSYQPFPFIPKSLL